tara:strand:+ start:123 stop:323 length:201 start_codon:yes stop_codon:yes gene_type:complete
MNILALVGIYKDQSLLIVAFGSSKELIFGMEESPLAQTRNLIIGNLFGGISAFFVFTVLGLTLFLS